MSSDFFQLMLPELSLTLIIFLLLFIRIQDSIRENSTVFHIANTLLILHVLFCFVPAGEGTLFSGLFHTGRLIQLEKGILSLGTWLISMQAWHWLKNHRHVAEFYILLLSTLLGMFFMLSSGNLLMFFLGLELASIPLAALVNFDLDKMKSSEAAVKMILSSAFASAIMLFGISMLYGTTGTITLLSLPAALSGGPLQALSLLFVFAGFAFKLSAVPFHLWTADVYEGAPVPVTAYLSVVSKASMIFVFISVLNPLFGKLQAMWYEVLVLTILLTITIGNLFALRQENIKRFLAFSSISQVGFLLLGLSANNFHGNAAAVYFLIIYLFSNLGAFGVITLVEAETGKESIADYSGFYRSNKWLSWVLALCLFSLAGVPPTAGFFGKLFLVTAGAGKGNWMLVTLAAANMVISLYYYLRIVKAVFVDEQPDPVPALRGSLTLRLALIVCVAGVLITGIFSGAYDYIVGLMV